MFLWAMALIAGLVGGVATGGNLSAVAAARPRATWLLVLAVALQASLAVLPAWSRPPVAVTACVVVVGWCAANRSGGLAKLAGSALFGLGVALNAVVMALNGGMPVSAQALVAAGLQRSTDVARGDLYKHTFMTAHTTLAGLGDTVPFALAHTVLSPGDLVMLGGLVALSWAATRGPRAEGVRVAKLASRTGPAPQRS